MHMARCSLSQVCLLPLTPDTKHIINSELLAWLPKVRLCWCRLPLVPSSASDSCHTYTADV